jgi:hypothetical protein
MTTKTTDGDVIRLIDGPMDGYLVRPGAPALRKGWYKTWPSSVAVRFSPGRYEAAKPDEDGTRQARWVRHR